MDRLANIHRVSSAKVRSLQKRLQPADWKEGMTQALIETYFDDMVRLLRNGQLRYWREGDSYILFDFRTLKPSHKIFCISREYFHEKIIPKLYKL